MSSSKSYALSLVAETKSLQSKDLTGLVNATLRQFELIQKLEGEAAFRAIFTGLGLLQVKTSIKHGHFESWLKNHVPKSLTSCNFYMRLALAFIEETHATKAELLAISGASFELSTTDVDGRRFIKRMEKFVGELSLTDLLIKHGIRGVGLKSSLCDGADDDEANLSPEEQLKRARERVFGETAEHLLSLRKTLTDTSRLQLLRPSELIRIDSELAELRRAIATITGNAA